MNNRKQTSGEKVKLVILGVTDFMETDAAAIHPLICPGKVGDDDVIILFTVPGCTVTSSRYNRQIMRSQLHVKKHAGKREKNEQMNSHTSRGM